MCGVSRGESQERYIDSPILRDRDVNAGGDLGKSGSGLARISHRPQENQVAICHNLVVVNRLDYAERAA
jgi:hypothetical protein